MTGFSCAMLDLTGKSVHYGTVFCKYLFSVPRNVDMLQVSPTTLSSMLYKPIPLIACLHYALV